MSLLNKLIKENYTNPFYQDVKNIELFYSKLLKNKEEFNNLEIELTNLKTEIYNKNILSQKINWINIINQSLLDLNYKKQGLMFISKTGTRIHCNKFIRNEIFLNYIKKNPKLLSFLSREQLDKFEQYKSVIQFSNSDKKLFYSYKKNNIIKNELSFLDKHELNQKNKQFEELRYEIRRIEKKLFIFAKVLASKFFEHIYLNNEKTLLDKFSDHTQKSPASVTLSNYNFVKEHAESFNLYLKELQKFEIDFNFKINRLNKKAHFKVFYYPKPQFTKNKIEIKPDELFLVILLMGILKYKELYVSNLNSRNNNKSNKEKILFEYVLSYYFF